MNVAAKIEKLMKGKGNVKISHMPYIVKENVFLKYRATVYNDRAEVAEIFETLDRHAFREYLIENDLI